MQEKIDRLKNLTEGAIDRLKQLPQPVVRVSGPLTSGGFGYDENLRRFVVAQQKLRELGYTVYDYFENNTDEDVIKELDLPGDVIMEYYHTPILQTGLITSVFMIPKWEESGGATKERVHFAKQNLPIKDIPEEWFL